MITIARFITIAIIGLLVSSCHFDMNFNTGKTGNGNVVSEERDADETFTKVKASEGLDVYITQSNTQSIEVEADENIISLIATDINNGVLTIHTKENIGRAKSKKIYVSLPEIDKIVSTSGADVYSTDVLVAEDLEVKSNSGADIKIEVKAESVFCSTSSGADIKISGTANSLRADASSGSDIHAKDLEVKTCNASASSGADVTVNTSEKLDAKSSSGGDIHYYGNPESVSKNKSVSGGVYKK
ncbi:head GIN domain-containing protein [uncultured Kordia sp.]|uniref:head GIN domain-containing protein n=1 Tax=uncultured Kordia sp. TaxID=507699 RepID=UPI00260FCB90|nr:head GIN domain-containing protein [uncultured Kordia sp.]